MVSLFHEYKLITLGVRVNAFSGYNGGGQRQSVMATFPGTEPETVPLREWRTDHVTNHN